MADYTARSSVVLNGKQAEDQLEALSKRALSKRAGTLREEMKKLRKANNLAGFKEKEKELREVNKEMGQYKKEIFSVDKVLRNLSGASIKDLTTAQRKLNNEMKVMDRNSKEFREAAKNAALLKNEISKAKIETGQWQSPMQRLLGQAKGLLPALGIGTIVTGIVRTGKELFNLSSQIQGETIRSVTVFGNQLGYVEQQAEKVADKMGVTNREFVIMAANTADLLIPLDFTREQAAKMSTEVQGLAGALDEWTAGQIGVTEVSNILTKAMLGENEQLKRLGIAIRKDTEEYRDLVKQKLETENVTRAQAEAMATLELLYKKSADAQAAYQQEGNKLLRLQKSVSLWWKNMKEGVVNYFMENQVDKLRREQEEVNGLVVELRSANIEQERREQIMNRLKQIAPELLKSITDEKSNIEDLTAAVAEYNKEMALKILIAEGESDIAKQKSKVDAFRNLTAKAEADLARQMKKSLDWFEKKAPGVKQTAEEILFDTQKTLLQKGEELNALALKNTALGNAALFHSLDSYRTFRNNYSQELNALDILVSQTNHSKKEWQQIFGGEEKNPGSGSNNNKVALSLFEIQEKLLEQAKKMPETTEPEIAVKNKKIAAIEKEIKRLKQLGIEKAKTEAPAPDMVTAPDVNLDTDTTIYDADALAHAEMLAAKKAGEEEWTEFLKSQIEDRENALAQELQIETAIEQARQDLKDIRINAISQIAGAIAGMFERGSAAYIAFFALEKAMAIAQVWMSYAKESAAHHAVAATMGPAGIAYDAAMQAKALTTAGVNTGIIVAQAIAQVAGGKKAKTYAEGKYPVTAEDGETYNAKWAGRPKTGGSF